MVATLWCFWEQEAVDPHIALQQIFSQEEKDRWSSHGQRPSDKLNTCIFSLLFLKCVFPSLLKSRQLLLLSSCYLKNSNVSIHTAYHAQYFSENCDFPTQAKWKAALPMSELVLTCRQLYSCKKYFAQKISQKPCHSRQLCWEPSCQFDHFALW